MDIPDALERVVWTMVAAGLAALPSVLADLPYWWVAVLLPVINYALVWVRTKVDALPSPGEGLPGLPAENPG
jgi:hypothetical protein